MFSNLFFETKNIDVEQKHNLNSRKSKEKKKGFQRENKTGNQKQEKRFQEKTVAIEYFDVVLFMKQKQRRKKMKEREKDKEQKESKT